MTTPEPIEIITQYTKIFLRISITKNFTILNSHDWMSLDRENAENHENAENEIHENVVESKSSKRD